MIRRQRLGTRSSAGCLAMWIPRAFPGSAYYPLIALAIEIVRQFHTADIGIFGPERYLGMGLVAFESDRHDLHLHGAHIQSSLRCAGIQIVDHSLPDGFVVLNVLGTCHQQCTSR